MRHSELRGFGNHYGAVPITNGGAFMAEPLKNGETCLEFQNAEGLVSVIERALSMDEREVEQVRNSMWDYYDRFLEPRVCAETFLRSHSSQILVNAEEKSLPQVYFYLRLNANFY